VLRPRTPDRQHAGPDRRLCRLYFAPKRVRHFLRPEMPHSFRGGGIGGKSQPASQSQWQPPEWNHPCTYASILFPGTGEAPPSARAGELTSRSTPPLPLTAELVRQLSGLVSGSPCLRRAGRFAPAPRPATCRTGSAALPPLLRSEKSEAFRRGCQNFPEAYFCLK